MEIRKYHLLYFIYAHKLQLFNKKKLKNMWILSQNDILLDKKSLKFVYILNWSTYITLHIVVICMYVQKWRLSRDTEVILLKIFHLFKRKNQV